ncbi:hypothetical protein D3C78_1920750 [compost metagenome]
MAMPNGIATNQVKRKAATPRIRVFPRRWTIRLETDVRYMKLWPMSPWMKLVAQRKYWICTG